MHCFGNLFKVDTTPHRAALSSLSVVYHEALLASLLTDKEATPAERRKGLSTILDRVDEDERKIVGEGVPPIKSRVHKVLVNHAARYVLDASQAFGA